MQVDPLREAIVNAFEIRALPFVQKSTTGRLNNQDLVEINKLVGSCTSEILNTISSRSEGKASSIRISVTDIEEQLNNRISNIKEQNLGVQRSNLIRAVQSGVISYTDLTSNVLPFNEKMTIILSEAPLNAKRDIELTIEGVPGKNGKATCELKFIIKEDHIRDGEGTILSQISDPIYREELVSDESKKHYRFEFFDVARDVEKQQKLQELSSEKKSLNAVKGHFQQFFNDEDEELFNKNLTGEQKVYFGLPEDKTLNLDEIYQLYSNMEEMLEIFPSKEESTMIEFDKATILGRFREDGFIGELKSVSIHSPRLGGKELMDFWNDACGFMGAREVYLEDDARIEGKSGSYNLRLFRLMALPDKASWYLDTYDYHPYQKTREGVIEDIADSKKQAQQNIAPFKEMRLSDAVALLSREGVPVNDETLVLLNRYSEDHSFGGDKTLGDLAKYVGDHIRRGEELHKELDQILSITKAFSMYKGTEPGLLELKEKAEQVVNERFYRKSYA